MELSRNSHHIFQIMYHFVWIPKYRHKIFEEPFRSELKAIIHKIAYDYDIDIVEFHWILSHGKNHETKSNHCRRRTN